jgi:hypothetical protein
MVETAPPRRLSWRVIARLLIGVGLAAALAVIAVNLNRQLDAVGATGGLRVGRIRVPDPDAVQAALVYARAAFQALLAIGLAIAAYILTRVQE